MAESGGRTCNTSEGSEGEGEEEGEDVGEKEEDEEEEDDDDDDDDCDDVCGREDNGTSVGCEETTDCGRGGSGSTGGDC